MSVPYIGKLFHAVREAGPMVSSDLAHFLERVPKFTSPSSFNMSFMALFGTIPHSFGNLEIDVEKSEIKAGEIHPYPRSDLESVLKGGKLETLHLGFPGFYGKEEDFDRTGDAFEILRKYLSIMQKEGYNLVASSFKLGHYMVNGESNKFYSKTYQAKIMVHTEEMVKGRPERKLVLEYTPDVKSSPEAVEYMKFLDEFNSRGDLRISQ